MFIGLPASSLSSRSRAVISTRHWRMPLMVRSDKGCFRPGCVAVSLMTSVNTSFMAFRTWNSLLSRGLLMVGRAGNSDGAAGYSEQRGLANQVRGIVASAVMIGDFVA